MVLHYERPTRVRSLSYEGMGTVDNGVSLQYLPGTCGWGGGVYPDIPLEPLVVYFDLPRDGQSWAPAGQRDTTIDAAAAYPDVASLTRYLNDPERRWVFYVDDATNISISFGAWPRGGGVVASAANGGASSTDHSLTASGGKLTSDAGTRPASTADGGVEVAPGAPVGAVDSSRPTDKSSTSRTSPAPHGPGRRKDGRTEGQAILVRGIWQLAVTPGPYGVRLSFNASRYHRVLVQFSHKPPPWDDREGHWGYPAGWDSPWYAEIEHQLDSDRYTAIPFSKLKAGARYHYLISVVGADNVPLHQRTGVFTAAFAQSQ
jgi:hypothetical protein